jgi:chromosome segregation ATPase
VAEAQRAREATEKATRSATEASENLAARVAADKLATKEAKVRQAEAKRAAATVASEAVADFRQGEEQLFETMRTLENAMHGEEAQLREQLTVAATRLEAVSRRCDEHEVERDKALANLQEARLKLARLRARADDEAAGMPRLHARHESAESAERLLDAPMMSEAAGTHEVQEEPAGVEVSRKKKSRKKKARDGTP